MFGAQATHILGQQWFGAGASNDRLEYRVCSKGK